MKKYRCTVCDWVYDPELGDPDAGIAPGTAFEDLPDDFVCPLCGVGKEDFEPIEDYILFSQYIIESRTMRKKHRPTFSFCHHSPNAKTNIFHTTIPLVNAGDAR